MAIDLTNVKLPSDIREEQKAAEGAAKINTPANLSKTELPNDTAPGRDQIISNFHTSIDADSDKEAKIDKLAKKTGVSNLFASSNYETLVKSENIPNDAELKDMSRSAPNIYQFFMNPENTKVAKDDVKNLTAFEAAVQPLKIFRKESTELSMLSGLMVNESQPVQFSKNYILGRKLDSASIDSGKAVINSAYRTYYQAKFSNTIADERARVRSGNGSEYDKYRNQKEIERLRNVMSGYPQEEGIGSFAGATSEFILQQIYSLPTIARYAAYTVPVFTAAGAVIGSAALGAGAIPGAIGGGAAGLKTAAITGMISYASQIESNFAFDEFSQLRDKDGNPLPFEKIDQMAETVGLINGLLEGAGDLIGAKVLAPVLSVFGKGVARVVSKNSRKAINNVSDEAVKLAEKNPAVQSVLDEIRNNIDKYEGLTWKTAVKNAVKTVFLSSSEIFTEFTQEAVTASASTLLQEKSLTDEAGSIIKRAYEVVPYVAKGAFGIGLIGAGGQFITTVRLQDAAITDAEKKVRQIYDEETYKNVGEKAGASKLLSRDSERFSEVADAVFKDSDIENIYIETEPLERLLQEAGIPIQEAFKNLNITDAAYTNAKISDSAIEVPYAKWLSIAKNIKTEGNKTLYDAMSNNIKFTPEGYTKAEREASEKKIAESITEEVDKAQEINNQAESDANFFREYYRQQFANNVRPSNINEKQYNKYIDAVVEIATSRHVTDMTRRGVDLGTYLEQTVLPEINVNLSVEQQAVKSIADDVYTDIVHDIESNAEMSKKAFNWFDVPVKRFQAEYEKRLNKKIDLPRKKLGELHKNVLENAVRDGAIVSNSLLKIYNINPDFLYKEQTLFQKKAEKLPDENYYKKPDKNIRLPDLSASDLALIGKTKKPVLLKKNIVEKNKLSHPEISITDNNNILANSLYQADLILQPKPQEKPNYYQFIKVSPDGKHISSVIEINENKDNFEVVSWYRLKDRTLKQTKEKTGREGGLFLITERANSQGAAGLSALPSGDNIIEQNKKNIKDNKPPEINKQNDYDAFGNRVPRGFVEFRKGQAPKINLTANADASTFLHELAHYFLKDIFDYIQEGGNAESIVRDWNILKNYLDIKDGQKNLTTSQQEQFAKAFEKYLMEGVSPSETLRRVFRQVAGWIKRVYRTLLFGNLELTPEVRQVMDRMFATDEEMIAKESGLNYDFEERIKNFTEEQKKRLRKVHSEAYDLAYEKVQAALMADISPEYIKDLSEFKKIAKEQAENEILQEPLYVAEKDIAELLSKKNIRDFAAKYDNTSNDELMLQFDMYAKQYGFENGTEFAQKLVESPLFDEAVNVNYNNKLQEYTAAKEKEISSRIESAMINGKMLEVLALEKDILQSAVRQVSYERAKVQAALYRVRARELLEQLPVKEAIRSSIYITAERNAAVDSAKAQIRGYLPRAARLKEKQLINHALACESLQIRRQYEKSVRILLKAQRRKKALFRQDRHFEQVSEILARFGFERSDYEIGSKAESLQGYIDGLSDHLDVFEISDFIINETNRATKLNELTVNQMQDVVDSVQNIIRYANMENRTFVLLQGADLNDLGLQLKEHLDKTVSTKKRDKNTEQLLKREREKGFAKKTVAAINRLIIDGKTIDTLAYEADGYKDFGFFYETFVAPAKKAADLESKLLRESSDAYIELLKKLYTKKELAQYNTKEIFVKEFNNTFTRTELIALALNLGNEGNRQRVNDNPIIDYKGDRALWNLPLVESTLSNYLTEADWLFVQGFWDIIAKNKAEAFAMHQELTGFRPKEVDSIPFQVQSKDGKPIQMKGGYYPLKYDYRANERSRSAMEVDDPLYTEQSPAWRNTTKQGQYKSRMRNVKSPVMLDMRIGEQHIFDVIHDIAFRPLVLDMNRVLLNDSIADLLKKNLGLENFRVMQSWVKTFGYGDSTVIEAKGINKVFEYFRRNVSLSILTLKPSIIMQNLSNFFILNNVVDGFGAAQVKDSVAYCIANAVDFTFDTARGKQIKDCVYGKSTVMYDRSRAAELTIREGKKGLTGKDGILAQAGQWAMVSSDNLALLPAWIVAYNQGVGHLRLSEQQAIARADLLVQRVVGTGRRYDASKFTRSREWLPRLFNPFSTFMMNELNRWMKETGMALDQKTYGRFAGFAVSRLFLFALISEVFSGRVPDDLDDEKSWYEWIFSSIGNYFFGMMPYIRAIGPGIIDSFAGKKSYSSRQLSPVVESIVSGVVKPATIIGKNVNQIVRGKRYKQGQLQTDVEQLTQAALIDLKMPTALNYMFFNLYDIFVNGMDPELRDIFRRRPKRDR